MTTLAYRDGVLAADTLVSSEGIVTGHTTKILRREDGALAGGEGDAGVLAIFLDWFKRGCPENNIPSYSSEGFVGIIIQKNGGVSLVQSPSWMAFPVRADFHALGSGLPIALGAMAWGANAIEAVEVAMRFDSCTGGEVESLRLEDGPV